MYFSVLISVISLAGLSIAAPVASPQATRIETRNATATESVGFSVTQTVFPEYQSRWKSKSPDTIVRTSSTGHLLNSKTEQVITAVNFALSGFGGKTCKLVFRLSQDDWIVSGSSTPAVFDIYRVNACVNDAYTWNTRPQRGVLAASVTPVKGGAAAWQSVDMSADTFEPLMGSAPTFSCVQGDYSFEMVARPGVNVGWTGKKSGLSIEVCG